LGKGEKYGINLRKRRKTKGAERKIVV